MLHQASKWTGKILAAMRGLLLISLVAKCAAAFVPVYEVLTTSLHVPSLHKGWCCCSHSAVVNCSGTDVHDTNVLAYAPKAPTGATFPLVSFSHGDTGGGAVEPKAYGGFLERTAVAAGVSNVFALSTHTMQWFMERGFSEVPLQALPERRVAIYNHERGSKIYMKNLATTREVDAEELFWVASLAKENGKAK